MKIVGKRARHGVANRWRLRFLAALSDQPLVEVFGFLRTLNHSGDGRRYRRMTPYRCRRKPNAETPRSLSSDHVALTICGHVSLVRTSHDICHSVAPRRKREQDQATISAEQPVELTDTERRMPQRRTPNANSSDDGVRRSLLRRFGRILGVAKSEASAVSDDEAQSDPSIFSDEALVHSIPDSVLWADWCRANARRGHRRRSEISTLQR